MAEFARAGVDDFTLGGVSKRAGADVLVAHWHDRWVLLMEAMLLTEQQVMPTTDARSSRVTSPSSSSK